MVQYIMYKIVCKDLNITDCYIGSTNNFKRRLRQHKHDCNNPNRKGYNKKLYTCIRLNGGWNNWNMIPINIYNNIEKYDALKHERKLIEDLKASLNMNIPSRTKKEYYLK